MKLLTIFCILSISATVLAEELTNFKINASGRVRGESVSNRDFDSSVKDSKNFIGNRFRMSLDFTANEKSKVFVELAHSGNWGANSANLTDGAASVHQAFISHKLNDSFNLLIGRKELAYGDQLLVGPVGWSNIGRSFDVIKGQWNHSSGWTDVFIADVTRSSTSEHYFSGIYNHLSLESIDNLDLYVFNTNEPATGQDQVIHYGTRIKSKADQFDYRLEATGQSEIEGHQADLELGYTLSSDEKTFRFSLEIFTSSKDYLQLFPTGHKWLGSGDFLSRKNLSGLRLGVLHQCDNKMTVKLDYHIFQRTDNAEPAYNFAGSTGGFGVLGTSTDVGSEADLNVSIPLDDNFSIALGGSYFFAGKYLEENNLNSDGTFYYLQTMIKL